MIEVPAGTLAGVFTARIYGFQQVFAKGENRLRQHSKAISTIEVARTKISSIVLLHWSAPESYSFLAQTPASFPAAEEHIWKRTLPVVAWRETRRRARSCHRLAPGNHL